MHSAAHRLARRGAAVEVIAVGESEEEPGGVKVPGAGGVDHGAVARGGCGVAIVAGDDDRSVRPQRDRHDLARRRGALDRGVEIVEFVQRHDLGLVGEEHVDRVLQQCDELTAEAIDAERVRQRERHATAGVGGQGYRPPERMLGRRWIPQVALEVDHRRPRDQRRIDIVGAELGRCSEECVHRPLGVGRDDDEGLCGGRPTGRRRGDELDPRSA